MMDDVLRIPTFGADGAFHVVVESPRGSRVKLKYDPALGAVRWGRPLTLGLSYPFDWGFVPGTHGPDGDPVDAMVLSEVGTYPGVVIPCRPVAVLQIEQKPIEGEGRERNDRILAVPVRAPRQANVQRLADLSARLRQELEEFFLEATAFEDKAVKIIGWQDGDRAAALLAG
jgi:inorganic pyrophosphatase